MKRHLLLMIFCIATISKGLSSVTIKGKFDNPSSKIIKLEYAGGSSTDSPNYYGPKSLCTYLDSNNEFKFVFSSSEDYCIYRIFYNEGNGIFELMLKDNDSINIYVDINAVYETFISKGNGSFFANYCLAQNLIKPKDRLQLADENVVSYWKEKRNTYVNLLNAFNNGEYSNNQISKKDIFNINSLIKATLTNPDEFDLIKSRLNLTTLSRTLYSTSFEYLKQNIDEYIQLFKNIGSNKNLILYDYYTDNYIKSYVQLQCFKDCFTKNENCTKKSAYQHLNKNGFEIAKPYLNNDLFQKYFADKLYHYLMYGKYELFVLQYKAYNNLISNNSYLQTIDSVYQNYLTALDNKEFNLNSKEKILNDSSVNELLNTLKGQKVYLVLWKINPKTSYTLTPLFNLSKLDMVETIYKDKKVRFVNICLGDESIKQHWASMIINHNWKGEHYLYCKGDMEDFNAKFNIKKKMQYCSGQLYYLIDESGNIILDNKSNVIVDLD